MKTRKVVSKENLPTYLPFTGTGIIYLLMDKFNPNEWVWGVVGTIVIFFWIGAIVNIFWKEEDTKVFKE